MLDAVVVRLELCVRDRPVTTDAIASVALEVLGPEAERDGAVVDRAATDATAIAAMAAHELLVTVDPAAVIPVEAAEHRDLVLAQVLVGVEPWASFEDNDLPAGLSELLREHRPGGATADDAHLDLALVVAHPVAVVLDLEWLHVTSPYVRDRGSHACGWRVL